MKENLEEVYRITKKLKETLSSINEFDGNRDNLIEQVNELIDRREKIIRQLNRPYSTEEMEIGRQIINMNEEIKEKMDLLYQSVKNDMKHVQKKKVQNYSYLKPYGNFKTIDGMYLDNKL